MPTYKRFVRRAHRCSAEDGSAMIITLMVMALVTALAATLTTVTISNLQSSWRAQQAGSAVNAADAGIAQAITHLRATGVRDINRCQAPSPTIACNAWANFASPWTVTVPGVGKQKYRVWIEAKAPYPDNSTGRYIIHSVGTAAERSYASPSGSLSACQRAVAQACREVSAEVQVSGTGIPKGIFARGIYASGSATVTNQSVFSTGCVYGRKKGSFMQGTTDLAFGIPPAVHSSDTITEENKANCDKAGDWLHGDGGNKGKGPKSTPKPNCNADFPFDQDSHGGPFDKNRATGATLSSPTPCATQLASFPNWDTYYGEQDLDKDGTIDVNGSFIKDDATLLKLFGLTDPALNETQLEQLRGIAVSQNNYWTKAVPDAWPNAADNANTVLFFDLTNASNRKVNLSNIPGYNRAKGKSASDSSCDSRSLIIVVVDGDMSINGGDLAASIFMIGTSPTGKVDKANGNVDFTGTIYADDMTLNGTSDLAMDTCFLNNPSPALLDFTVTNYQEVDR